MSNLAKLSVSLGLGAAAAAANWMWLSAQTKPALYVAVQRSVEQGTVIEEDDLVAVPLPSRDKQRLNATLFPFEKRAILFGMTATRDYQSGDIVFQCDVHPDTAAPRLQELGPFRLVSVGERWTSRKDDEEENVGSTHVNSITIAVPRKLDEKTTRLLWLMSPHRDEYLDDGAHIIALQVIPDDSREARSLASDVFDQDERMQTISLDGIVNVPHVLLAGQWIHFLVPASEES